MALMSAFRTTTRYTPAQIAAQNATARTRLLDFFRRRPVATTAGVLGAGALGYEAFNPEGDNPFIPNFLERPLKAAGRSAEKVLDWTPWILVGGGILAAVVLVRKASK